MGDIHTASGAHTKINSIWRVKTNKKSVSTKRGQAIVFIWRVHTQPKINSIYLVSKKNTHNIWPSKKPNKQKVASTLSAPTLKTHAQLPSHTQK